MIEKDKYIKLCSICTIFKCLWSKGDIFSETRNVDVDLNCRRHVEQV